MHVAGAADRRQQDVQIPSIFSDLGLSFIDQDVTSGASIVSVVSVSWWRHFVC
jgi:hypothetical protein